ncbi:hypothetical protein FVER53590_25038 [Fusarium verticillioides]|nr:hypothetical protein FVER53590_25038 [Fusarium verticillioides]
MDYSPTSTTIPCPFPSSEPTDATIQCTRPRCQQRRASRTRTKSSSNSPTTRSKHERSRLKCNSQSSECVGHPLGNVSVFQTSAIASALTSETESPKCHTNAPCHVHGDQGLSHSMLHTDKAINKSESRGVSHKRPRRQSHPPKPQHHQRQDLRLWEVNPSQLVNNKSCTSCQTEETPRWRTGPAGPRTLCNFCGLIYAKRQQKYHNAPSSQCFSSE